MFVIAVRTEEEKEREEAEGVKTQKAGKQHHILYRYYCIFFIRSMNNQKIHKETNEGP